MDNIYLVSRVLSYQRPTKMLYIKTQCALLKDRLKKCQGFFHKSRQVCLLYL